MLKRSGKEGETLKKILEKRLESCYNVCCNEVGMLKCEFQMHVDEYHGTGGSHDTDKGSETINMDAWR